MDPPIVPQRTCARRPLKLNLYVDILLKHTVQISENEVALEAEITQSWDSEIELREAYMDFYLSIPFTQRPLLLWRDVLVAEEDNT